MHKVLVALISFGITENHIDNHRVESNGKIYYFRTLIIT